MMVEEESWEWKGDGEKILDLRANNFYIIVISVIKI